MPAARPMPWCAGPKLNAFPLDDGANAVEILDHLGRGVHAEVFQVRIRDKLYALKVFRFFRARELVTGTILEKGLASVQDVINHNDPFHCECRVYGRLKEVNREDLAVRAFGYVLLDSPTEGKLADMGFDDWQRYDAVKSQPLRCIVKELLPTSVPTFRFEMLPQMRRDLQDLHAYGIIVWDIRSDNYMGGLVVDFSQAKTVPHIELSWDANPISRKWAIDNCSGDYDGFDGMVYEWNEGHPEQVFWHPFLPNTDFGRRLRNQSRYDAVLNKQEGVRLDAIFYDWKNKQPWVVRLDNRAGRPTQKTRSASQRKDDKDIPIIKRRGKRVQKKPALRRKPA